MLNDFLKNIIHPSLRLKLKKSKRKLKSFFINEDKVTLIDVKVLLVENFGIKKGDNVIITSSFGNLNAAFSPIELIELLKELVGISGNIVMPFYPGNSYELIKENITFDMKYSRSAMGILTQVFSEDKDVYKSIHPTKSVVAWGANAKEIIKNHHLAETPYDVNTPYGWLYANGSKSIGICVKSVPMFHYCEDTLYLDKLDLYLKSKPMTVITSRFNKVVVDTKAHNPKVLKTLMEIGDYLYLNKPKSYIRKKIGYNFCYYIDNNELYKFCKVEFKKGNFRYKK